MRVTSLTSPTNGIVPDPDLGGAYEIDMIKAVARPIWHVLSALPISALAFRRGGRWPALAAAAGAVAIDADHLVDWVLNGGRQDYSRRIVVPLHGWELPALVLAAAQLVPLEPPVRRSLAALAAGWACHLWLDFLVNRPDTPAGYLLTRRLVNGFDRLRSGWLPPAEWRARRRSARRWAPRETAAAALLGCLLLLVASRG